MKKRRGMSFLSSERLKQHKNINKHLFETEQQRQRAERGQKLQRCNAAVIKETHQTNTENTPAVTDGGSPGKEERGQRTAGRGTGRRERGRNNKEGGKCSLLI